MFQGSFSRDTSGDSTGRLKRSGFVGMTSQVTSVVTRELCVGSNLS